MTTQDDTQQRLRCDILLKEYELANNNYNDVLTQYRQQVNFLNIYIAFFAAMVFFLFKEELVVSSRLGPSIGYAVFLFTSLSVLFYVYALGIDIVFNLYLTEGRAAAVEREINEIAGRKTLHWFHEVVPYYNLSFIASRAWVNPGYMLGFYNGLILLSLSFFHDYLALALFTRAELKVLFIVVNLLCVSFLLHQLLVTTMIGLRQILDVSYSKRGQHPDYKVGQSGYHLAMVPIATFALGFLPFALCSLLDGSFWFDSTAADIPFLSIATISLGDSILLPLINYRIARMLFEPAIWNGVLEQRTRLIRWAMIAAGVSVAVNALSHYAWATDQYTDFISMTAGTMTFGGWWHLLFSIVQMWILVMFLPLWMIALEKRDSASAQAAGNTWTWVTLFGSLLVLNFSYQYAYVFSEPSLLSALYVAKFTFGPLSGALVVRLVMNWYAAKTASRGALDDTGSTG